MAEERFNSAISTLFDSSGLPDVNDVRKEELKNSCAFKYPWFAKAWDLKTIEQFWRVRWFEKYTGFGTHRSRIEELGRVSLSNRERIK